MGNHTLSMAALTAALFASFPQAQQKRPVDLADQLPVHSYTIQALPSAMLRDESAVARLADSVRLDLEADLATYDIRDSAALRSYYRALSTIAMLQRRFTEAVDHENKARDLEDKPALRMLSGMTLRPLIAAEKSGSSGAAQAFSAALAAELARTQYDVVQAELKTTRGGLEILSPTFLEGIVAAQIDPAVHDGRISKETALALLNRSFTFHRVLPYRAEIVRQLSALIDARQVTKTEIWSAREVSLDGRSGLEPVRVAIYDTGVDASLFEGRMWTNANEVPGNDTDDDRNGYVDDVHGIAWSWDGQPRTGDLRPLELSTAAVVSAKQSMKGFLDLQAGVDSPEAEAVKRRLATIPKDEAKPLIEGLMFYSAYAHGTHVAGIATRGNPAARVLIARFEPPYRLVPPAPDAAWATGFARSIERTVEYFRSAGVRVVNMSFGMAASDLEHDLETSGYGASPGERHQIAVQSYNTVKTAFSGAIAAAPEILFVAAAGNSNENNQFNEAIPASFDMPHIMTVGAVDRAGDEAAFTSFGKVDVYANGYEVESVLPGGDTLRWSGTSMASPQVVNLAAKLFAAYPRLDARTVKKLIVDGADTKVVSDGRSIRLLNASRAFELAKERSER